MTEPERRKLWVKAGGRCTLCKAYLLEGGLTHAEVAVGEGAHIVGQAQTAGSPRGLADLAVAERDKAENILLACSSCHTEIDKQLVVGVLTVEELRKRKRAHEDEIRHQTSMATDRRTAVLRAQGWVRGAVMELGRNTAATAVIRSGLRFPLFLPAYDQHGIEIDLRHLGGESDGTAAYYTAAMSKIDAGVHRVREAVLGNHIDHLSIFAIARMPLLCYLGWALDDGIATDVYQRHRSSGDWAWPPDAAPTSFAVSELRAGQRAAQDAVLITNLSGTTHLENVPADLVGAPAFLLDVSVGSSHEDVISTPGSLAAFEDTVRRFFSQLEVTHKPLARLHVFGAMPVAAAVTFGRALKARAMRPAVVLYDLSDGGYHQVMEF